MKIDRVDISEIELFRKNYFDKDVPIILTGAIANSALKSKKFNYFEKYIKDNTQLKLRRIWHEGTIAQFSNLIDTPKLVANSISKKNAYTRATCVRLWLSKKANFTPLHYDGSLIFIFNLQIVGRKHWTLIPPSESLSFYPLIRYCNIKYIKKLSDRIKRYEFTLHPGEMIFVPPLYSHAVRAKDNSVNIHWIGTNKKNTATLMETKTYKREIEMLKFFHLLAKYSATKNLISKLTFNFETSYNIINFTGNKLYSKNLADSVRNLTAVKRFLLELIKFPAPLLNLKEIKKILPKGPALNDVKIKSSVNMDREK